MLLRSYSFEKYKSKSFLFFKKNGAIIFAIFCGSEDPPHDPKIFFPDIKSKGFNLILELYSGWEAKKHFPPNFLVIENANSIDLFLPVDSIV